MERPIFFINIWSRGGIVVCFNLDIKKLDCILNFFINCFLLTKQTNFYQNSFMTNFLKTFWSAKHKSWLVYIVGENNIGAPKMQNNSGVPKMQNNIGVPKIQKNIGAPKIHKNIDVPKMQKNIGAPKMQNNIGAPKIQKILVHPKSK